MPKNDKREDPEKAAPLPAQAQRTVAFLLLPGFALVSYACAIEPLRAANVLAQKPLYRWLHVTPDGSAAQASNGALIDPVIGLSDQRVADDLVVCMGGNPAAYRSSKVTQWLRRQAQLGVRLGGVSGGPYLLARAGLLEGYRFTLHWEHLPAFREEFPHLHASNAVYELDRNRFTASGGTAALEMMTALVGKDHGRRLAAAVAEWFLQTQLREPSQPQRASARSRYDIAHSGVLAALQAMEQNIEEPLDLVALSQTAGVSQRQLQRLFMQYLQCTPLAFYKKIRLDRARLLLAQTARPVTEIAIACGFASAQHFSRAYRLQFGSAPSRARTPA